MKKFFSSLKSIKPILAVACLLAANIGYSATHYYVVAHQDDWQLFMNPNAYHSIDDGHKTVFVHTTAGDAGIGVGDKGRKYNGESKPYYLAREEGALRAIRFLVNSKNGNRGAEMNSSTLSILGRKVQRYEYGNAVAYFLRLPDGNPEGQGYEFTRYESLEYLHETNKDITPVDKPQSYLNTYKTWQDLTNTLMAIVNHEKNSTQLNFNLADTNSTYNPDDHSDHLHSSQAMQTVANDLNCIDINYYVEYDSKNLTPNVTGNDLLIDVGTWGATTSGIADFYHNNTWVDDHNTWLLKDSHRTESSSNLCYQSTNIAAYATVTASSQNTSTEQTANKAIDNIGDGWPGDYKKEWATSGGGMGSSLVLTWPRLVTITSVVLQDRPNLNDHITSAQLQFDEGSPVTIGAITNNGSDTLIQIGAPRQTTKLTLLITGVSPSTANIGLSEIRVYGECYPCVSDIGVDNQNIASFASVTASSQNNGTQQTAAKAIDNNRDGNPSDHTKEWATVGGGAGSNLTLNWSKSVVINRIVLVDRPNTNDHVMSGRLIFSDGSSVEVGSLNNLGGGDVFQIDPAKDTTSLQFVIDSVSIETESIGLAEIEVFGTY